MIRQGDAKRFPTAQACPWGISEALRYPLWFAAPARFRRQNLSDLHKQRGQFPS
jgi:hypothetical protein